MFSSSSWTCWPLRVQKCMHRTRAFELGRSFGCMHTTPRRSHLTVVSSSHARSHQYEWRSSTHAVAPRPTERAPDVGARHPRRRPRRALLYAWRSSHSLCVHACRWSMTGHVRSSISQKIAVQPFQIWKRERGGRSKFGALRSPIWARGTAPSWAPPPTIPMTSCPFLACKCSPRRVMAGSLCRRRERHRRSFCRCSRSSDAFKTTRSRRRVQYDAPWWACTPLRAQRMVRGA